MYVDLNDPQVLEQYIKLGNELFAKPCDFVTSVASLTDLTKIDEKFGNLAEIAFVGRSNVGKSSLINALTNHGSLAKTSQTPGRTQLLNFFNLNNQLLLVDLPGYGYAKANKKQVAAWNKLMMDYLQGRPQLRYTVLLIDSRHGIKKQDQEIMKILDSIALSYQIVFTKADKITLQQQQKLGSISIMKLKTTPHFFQKVL